MHQSYNSSWQMSPSDFARTEDEEHKQLAVALQASQAVHLPTVSLPAGPSGSESGSSRSSQAGSSSSSGSSGSFLAGSSSSYTNSMSSVLLGDGYSWNPYVLAQVRAANPSRSPSCSSAGRPSPTNSPDLKGKGRSRCIKSEPLESGPIYRIDLTQDDDV